ncbi:sialic acid-binding Ig-like lectin 13 [Erinaceus europaeus]|uniref:Sialic acid-binding Ig-like lectin 13 n=1 Tax=Erinaceus europaeus TaxID=9365 RepID=A0A1S3WTW1_ERIEU|nr:sialic acid-binding Ig-like lectin 13 [Erinaceus europaeus]
MLLRLLPLLWAGSLAQDSGFQPQIQELVTVQEGLCVPVPCRVPRHHMFFLFYHNVHGYWFREGADTAQDAPVATTNPHREVQKDTLGRFIFLGDLRTQDCTLFIRDAKNTDQGKYFFKIETEHPSYHPKSKLSQVQVTVLTHTPNILIPGTLESGYTVNLNCSVPWACEKGTPPTFSWIGGAITSQGPSTPFSSVLTLTPRPQDHGSSLTCQVIFPGANVSTERTVQLSVTYPPHSMTVTAFLGNSTGPMAVRNGSSLQVPEGQSLHLVCEADSNPPSDLRWSRDKLALSPSLLGGPAVLVLPQVDARDQGTLTCRAQNPLGSQHVTLSLSLQRSPEPLAELVLVAILEAAVKSLLLLLCLVILLRRSHSKEVFRTSGSKEDTNTTKC